MRLRLASCVLRPASRIAAGMRTLLVLVAPVAALLAQEDRGEPSVLRGIFGIALLIFGPIVGGIVLGLLQMGVYHGFAKAGMMKVENIPIFPIFLMRGLIVMIAIIAGTMFWLKASGNAVPMTFPG